MIRYDIIKRPLITEKASIQKEVSNQLSFEVKRKSNRVEIKRSIEKIFNVKVIGLQTMQVKGKKKRRGRIIGRRRDWKKAIVTLAPGERIDFFVGCLVNSYLAIESVAIMAVKKVNPTSPGRRFQVYSTFKEVTRSTPEKNLLKSPQKRVVVVMQNGRITSRHKGGGHKKALPDYRFQTRQDRNPGKGCFD